MICLKSDRLALNSAHPDQTPRSAQLVWVYYTKGYYGNLVYNNFKNLKMFLLTVPQQAINNSGKMSIFIMWPTYKSQMFWENLPLLHNGSVQKK